MEIIEKIIQFIASHPLIAVSILVAIVSSLGRSKKKGSSNRMPDFGDSANHEDKRYDEYGDEERVGHQTTYASAGQSPATIAAPSTNTAFDAETDELRQDERGERLAAIARIAGSISSNAAASLRPHGPIPTAASNHKPQGLNKAIGSDEVIQGVIWAEVLGPPRAKLPFNQRR